MNSVRSESICIYADINAPYEAVFDAWLDPSSIGRWMFKPWNDKIIKISTQGFPDTLFSFLIERAGQRINHVGTYIEVRRPHRLVFSWGIEGWPIGDSRVAIDFEPNGRKTYLTLTHRGVDPEYRLRTSEGWEKIIASLQETLDTHL
jgi:uncharacterized protein YndB with AHSA1/START domain